MVIKGKNYFYSVFYLLLSLLPCILFYQVIEGGSLNFLNLQVPYDATFYHVMEHLVAASNEGFMFIRKLTDNLTGLIN